MSLGALRTYSSAGTVGSARQACYYPGDVGTEVQSEETSTSWSSPQSGAQAIRSRRSSSGSVAVSNSTGGLHSRGGFEHLEEVREGACVRLWEQNVQRPWGGREVENQCQLWPGQ